jgi:hypothetical protein
MTDGLRPTGKIFILLIEILDNQIYKSKLLMQNISIQNPKISILIWIFYDIIAIEKIINDYILYKWKLVFQICKIH